MRRTRVRPLTPHDLDGLVWPEGAAPLRGLSGTDAPQEPWALAAQQRWGLCGVAVDVPGHDEVARFALVGAGLHLPAGHPLGHWSRVGDAAHLLALCVGPRGSASSVAPRQPSQLEAGSVLTRELVQALARHLVGKVVTLEAVGAHGNPAAVPRWPREERLAPGGAVAQTSRSNPHLVPPMTWLAEAGFTSRDDFPAMAAPGSQWCRATLSLTQTLRWTPGMERAWGLVSAWIPRPGPEVGPVSNAFHVTARPDARDPRQVPGAS